MKKLIFLACTLPVLFFSCGKEIDSNTNQEEASVKQESNVIKKDFELKSHYFNNSKLKSGGWSINNNFGEGLDILTNVKKISIFNPSPALDPIISNAKDEITKFVYISTSNYSEIDQSVKTALTVALSVNTPNYQVDTKLSVANQQRITRASNSVYVCFLYIKQMGRSRLQYTAPSINNYLTYSTLRMSGESPAINATQFRNTYGDKFKSGLTLGVTMIATIQITDVDMTLASSEVINASVKASVSKVVDGSSTWASEKSTNQYIKNSSMIIEGQAIPRTSDYIMTREQIISNMTYLSQCYLNDDLGILLTEYDLFSAVYPNFNFINAVAIKDKMDKWIEIKGKLTDGLSGIQNQTLYQRIQNEINICQTNIQKCQNLTSAPYPGDYTNYYLEIIWERTCRMYSGWPVYMRYVPFKYI